MSFIVCFKAGSNQSVHTTFGGVSLSSSLFQYSPPTPFLHDTDFWGIQAARFKDCFMFPTNLTVVWLSVCTLKAAAILTYQKLSVNRGWASDRAQCSGSGISDLSLHPVQAPRQPLRHGTATESLSPPSRCSRTTGKHCCDFPYFVASEVGVNTAGNIHAVPQKFTEIYRFLSDLCLFN